MKKNYVAPTMEVVELKKDDMILTSGAANGATLAFYEQMTGNTLSFIQWAGLMILPAAFICLCALVIARFFAGKPEPELARKLSDSTRLHDEYAKLGPMTAPEKRVLACVILVLVLWCFGDLVGLKAGFAAILVSALLFLPGMAVVEPRQAMRDVNWSIVLLVGCLVGFGAIVQDTGLADSLASAVFAPIMNPIHQHLGLLGICINVLLVSAIAHFLLPTPNNIVLAAPVLIAWGLSAGLDPAILLGLLVLPVAMHDRIVPLSYQYPPYYVMLGLDLVDTKSFNEVDPALRAVRTVPAELLRVHASRGRGSSTIGPARCWLPWLGYKNPGKKVQTGVLRESAGLLLLAGRERNQGNMEPAF